MKILKSFILTLLCLYLITTSAASQTLDIPTTKFLDNLLISTFPENEPGISILIAKDGNVLYKKAFGMEDVESKIPLSTDNVFAIGSMTKQFTAVSILILADEGRINLNDDIRKYLPEYNSHNETVTIENLLTHTSGIEGFRSFKQKITSKEDIINAIQNDGLIFKPGSNFSYSNSGFYLLGLIIEKVSGMTYQEFVQKNIFDPLNMTHSYFSSDSENIPMLAFGNGIKEGNSNGVSVPFQWSWPLSAGDILSTTGDLLLWNDALNGDKIIPQSLLQKAFTPVLLQNGMNTNYGFGWNVTSLGDFTVIEHGGSIGGFLCDAVRVPEQDLYIVSLSNNNRKSPTEINQKILLKLLNIPDEKPKPISIDENLLDQYAGTYETTRDKGRLIAYGEKKYYSIVREGDHLILKVTGWNAKFSFLPYEKDKFISDGYYKRYNFIRNADNNITAMEVYDYPVNFGMNDYCKKVNDSSPGK